MVDHNFSLFPIEISETCGSCGYGSRLGTTLSVFSSPRPSLGGPDTNDFFGEVDVLVGVARQSLALLEEHVENAANWVLNHLVWFIYQH